MFYYVLQFVVFHFWIGPIAKIILFDGPYEILDGTLEEIQRCCKRFKSERSESRPIR